MSDDPTAVVFRAMKAAGLDPRNRDHVIRFAEAMRAEIESLPERALARFQSGDNSQVAQAAADRVANEQQRARMERFNVQNDPSELFKLTDWSAGAAERRRQINQKEQGGRDAGPLPDDPNDLWKLARG